MDPFAELERSARAALETYSNVHRGAGHYSMASTHLYERAGEIVLDCMGLDKKRHEIIFGSPRRVALLQAQLRPGSYRCLSSEDLGLPLGVGALAVERAALPHGAPEQPGGGTARLVSRDWVVWAKAPDRFEPGTPAIVNVIVFARAMEVAREHGADAFQGPRETVAAEELLCRDALEGRAGAALLDELRKTLVGYGRTVPTTGGQRRFINLDHAASTPTFEPIWDVARRAWRLDEGSRAEVAREARRICDETLGAPASEYEVLFTSNTTEAINLVAESLRREKDPDVEPVVLNTLLEHNSNELPWRVAGGPALLHLPVDEEGFFDLAALEQLLREHNEERRHARQRIVLVTVCGASNVQGTFNDLAEIGRIAHRYGARLLVDGAQTVAHRSTDIKGCEIDYFAFSGHKIYAPFGTGALVARRGLLAFTADELDAIRASGEENTAGIAALAKALVLLRRAGFDAIQAEEQALTARALRGMATVPGVKVRGVKDAASPRFGRKGGVIAFDVGNLFPSRVARALAERHGIGVRWGCHCAHLAIKNLLHIPRPVEELQRAIVTLSPKVNLPGVVRVSLGIDNTEEDVDALVAALAEIAANKPGGSTELNGQMERFTADVARSVYAGGRG